ncbi:MAG: heterodisulfide reductase-related iron-sulfur binding cluster [Candidatus Binatia bacterium]
MTNTPAYDPIDHRYWDEKDLRSEVERIFQLCADCRLCNKFCGSFPKLFDAVDSYCTDEKYAEVDIKKFTAEDVKEVVAMCFQCKLCEINCPYTPSNNHEWAIDFPRLIARAKAIDVKKNGVTLQDRMLGNPDLIGKFARWTAPIANWANENKVHRLFMQGALGIHKDKKLPPFAWKPFAARFRSAAKPPTGEPSARIAYFSTCFVNYNEPGLGMDTLEVMARNNVDVAFAYERCCGMPLWHNGDMDGATTAARQNVTMLLRQVREGRKIVVTNPTCSQMIRVEYPRLLGTEEAKVVAQNTTDPTELLASLATRGKLNRDFKTGAGKVAYHMPCHLRTQNIGYKTRDVLSLLPDTTVEVIEACSGHDGTWAMKKENFEASLKWGGKAFRDIMNVSPNVTCSDCPLAAIQIQQGTGRKPLNPIEILAKSYRGDPIQDTDK